MGIKDTLGNLFGLDRDDDFEETGRYDDNFEEPEEEYEEPVRERAYAREEARESRASERSYGRSSASASASGRIRLIVNEPKSFDECSKIVDELKDRKPVIINLEQMESDVAKRLFDFISGATYALEGSVQKIANNIFVFAPNNVNIDSNIEQYKTLNNSNIFN